MSLCHILIHRDSRQFHFENVFVTRFLSPITRNLHIFAFKTKQNKRHSRKTKTDSEKRKIKYQYPYNEFIGNPKIAKFESLSY